MKLYCIFFFNNEMNSQVQLVNDLDLVVYRYFFYYYYYY